jgi:hypothetical protein
VYWTGRTPLTSALLLTVMTGGGAIACPDPNSPHPDAGSAQQAATTAAASCRPRRSFTRTSGQILLAIRTGCAWVPGRARQAARWPVILLHDGSPAGAPGARWLLRAMT